MQGKGRKIFRHTFIPPLYLKLFKGLANSYNSIPTRTTDYRSFFFFFFVSETCMTIPSKRKLAFFFWVPEIFTRDAPLLTAGFEIHPRRRGNSLPVISRSACVVSSYASRFRTNLMYQPHMPMIMCLIGIIMTSKNGAIHCVVVNARYEISISGR
jgi:hypothetical protein